MGSSNSTLADLVGGSTEGYHVLRVQDNSPGSTAKLQAYFDFIVAIGNTRLNQNNDTLKEILKLNLNREVKMTLYNSKMQNLRHINIVPSNTWGGQGLLGVSIRFCSFENATENVWHILEIEPNSPSAQAGLKPFSDYIIGSDSILLESEDLFSLIEAHEGKPLKLFVYNITTDSCREVIITPNSKWGGEGALGCGIGYGYLHRIPTQTNHIEFPEEIATTTDSTVEPIPSSQPLLSSYADQTVSQPLEQPPFVAPHPVESQSLPVSLPSVERYATHPEVPTQHVTSARSNELSTADSLTDQVQSLSQMSLQSSSATSYAPSFSSSQQGPPSHSVIQPQQQPPMVAPQSLPQMAAQARPPPPPMSQQVTNGAPMHYGDRPPTSQFPSQPPLSYSFTPTFNYPNVTHPHYPAPTAHPPVSTYTPSLPADHSQTAQQSHSYDAGYPTVSSYNAQPNPYYSTSAYQQMPPNNPYNVAASTPSALSPNSLPTSAPPIAAAAAAGYQFTNTPITIPGMPPITVSVDPSKIPALPFASSNVSASHAQQ
jgi:hypothetical protein